MALGIGRKDGKILIQVNVIPSMIPLPRMVIKKYIFRKAALTKIYLIFGLNDMLKYCRTYGQSGNFIPPVLRLQVHKAKEKKKSFDVMKCFNSF